MGSRCRAPQPTGRQLRLLRGHCSSGTGALPVLVPVQRAGIAAYRATHAVPRHVAPRARGAGDHSSAGAGRRGPAPRRPPRPGIRIAKKAGVGTSLRQTISARARMPAACASCSKPSASGGEEPARSSASTERASGSANRVTSRSPAGSQAQTRDEGRRGPKLPRHRRGPCARDHRRSGQSALQIRDRLGQPVPCCAACKATCIALAGRARARTGRPATSISCRLGGEDAAKRSHRRPAPRSASGAGRRSARRYGAAIRRHARTTTTASPGPATGPCSQAIEAPPQRPRNPPARRAGRSRCRGVPRRSGYSQRAIAGPFNSSAWTPAGSKRSSTSTVAASIRRRSPVAASHAIFSGIVKRHARKRTLRSRDRRGSPTPDV